MHVYTRNKTHCCEDALTLNANFIEGTHSVFSWVHPLLYVATADGHLKPYEIIGGCFKCLLFFLPQKQLYVFQYGFSLSADSRSLEAAP